MRLKVDSLSFALNLLATVTLIGLPLFAPRETTATLVREQPEDRTAVRGGLSVTRISPALVVTAKQKSYINDPLPLGMWLNNASGKETITIAGLVEGTELSLGSSRGLAGWVLLSGDIEKTFVAPPRDFIGVMHATVGLSAASGELLDSQVVEFEWTKTEDVIRQPVDTAKQPAVVLAAPPPSESPLNSEQIAVLVKVGENLLHSSDVSAARTVLKRAALAGNARAALELGMTFDRAFLTKWGVLGFDPDPAQAREWYERALKLGSTEASRHLQRLASVPK